MWFITRQRTSMLQYMKGGPMKAVKKVIFETKNVADASYISGVKNFVMATTEIVVKLLNVMGATKRFAEMIVRPRQTHRHEIRSSAIR